MSDRGPTFLIPRERSGLARLGDACTPTLRYWMATEVHVYAFSIAANVLLSFFPFLIVRISICRNLLHWRLAEQVILDAISDFLPGTVGEFVTRNLQATLWSFGPLIWYRYFCSSLRRTVFLSLWRSR